MNIAVYTNKGGVSKTTTVVHLARLWKKPVSVCDLDEQRAALSFQESLPDVRFVGIQDKSEGDCFYDCPPEFDHASPALRKADLVIVPVQCEFLPFRASYHVVQMLKEKLPEAQVKVLLTLFVPGLPLAREVRDEARDLWRDAVLNTIIFRHRAITEASAEGQTVLDYAPNAKPSQQFQKLTAEIQSITS